MSSRGGGGSGYGSHSRPSDVDEYGRSRMGDERGYGGDARDRGGYSRDSDRYDDRRAPGIHSHASHLPPSARYEPNDGPAASFSRPAPFDSRFQAHSGPSTQRHTSGDIGSGSYLEYRAAERAKRPIPVIWTRSPSRSRSPVQRSHKRPRREEEVQVARRSRRHRAASSSSRSGSSSPRVELKSHVGPTLPPVPLAPQALPAHMPVEARAPASAPVSTSPVTSDDEVEVGPSLPSDFNPPISAAPVSGATGGAYSHGMRPGEGAAIAGYVAANKRVPRRGEVGWDGDVIQHLEGVGFVMSGSRHARMNAIRMRKENQVYTAEEKKMLALMHYEERQAREVELRAEFARMVAARMAQGAAASGEGAPQEPGAAAAGAAAAVE